MHKRKKQLTFILSILLLCVLSIGTVAFADGNVDLSKGVSEQQVIELHEKMNSITHVDNGWMYQDAIRNFGWGVIVLESLLVNYIEEGVRGILQFNHFYDSFGIRELMEKLAPYVLGLFLLSFTYLGFLFMTNKIDKRNEVLGNVLIALTLIFAIPAMMPYLDKLMQVGVDQLDGSNQEEIMLSNRIIKQNVADVKYYVDTDFNFNQLGLPLDKNAPKGEKVGSLDYSKANKISGFSDVAINEKLDLLGDETWFGWWSTGYKKELAGSNPVAHDFLIHNVIPTGDGEKRLKALNKGKFGTDIGQESYYRYHINWWTVIFTLGIVAFALGITVIKMARVMFDLAFHAIFSPLVAATDLTGGQRTKKMVTEIVSSFAVLFVMVLILRIFTMYTNYVMGLTPVVGNVVALLMLIAGAWALLDAPDIVQRLLGIDAGLRSGYQALVGTLAAGKMAKGAIDGAGKVASGIGKGAAAGRAFSRGVIERPPTRNTKPIPPSGGISSKSGGSSSGTGNRSSSSFGQSDKTYSTGVPNESSQFSTSGVEQSNAMSRVQTDQSSPMNQPNTDSQMHLNRPSSKKVTDSNGGVQSSIAGGGQTISSGGSSPSVGSSLASSFDQSGATYSMNGSNEGTPFGVANSPQSDRNGFISTGASNPYQKGNGIRSGSVRGQRMANLQARSHNSGVAFRQSLTSGGRALGSVAMGSAKLARSPIRSVKNANLAVGMKTNQMISTANQQIESFGQGAKTLASRAVNESAQPLFDQNSNNKK